MRHIGGHVPSNLVQDFKYDGIVNTFEFEKCSNSVVAVGFGHRHKT